MSPTPNGSESCPTNEQTAPELSVVLPAHNEITLLGSTVTNIVTGLEARGLSFEILIVENGSHDGTLRLGRMLAAQLPAIRILTLSTGDYGAALATGFLASRGRLVANFDVDYYDLGFLDSAFDLLLNDDVDIVVASKRAPGSSDRRPALRRLLTAGFAFALRSVVQLEITDAHGMKLLRRSALVPIVDSCVMRKSLFDVEMVLRATRSGLKVREVPAVVVERRPPRTSVGRRVFESAWGLIRLRTVLRAEEQGGQTARRAVAEGARR